MAAPNSVIDLVECFDRNIDTYKTGFISPQKAFLQQINTIDKQIDKSIYEQYCLAEEIKIVEGSG